MQPGYPPSGQDPYGQPYTDPSGQGQYGVPQQPEQPKPQEYQQQSNPNDPAPSPFAPDYSQPQQFTMPQSYEQQSYEQQPQYQQQPTSYEQPQPQSYAQPAYEQPPPPAYQQQPPPYADPYAQPTSGAAQAFPVSANPYQVSGGAYVAPAPPPGYPAPGYQVPGYGPPPGTGSANALGIVSLCLGILSIPMGCCSFFGLILPIPAIICGILGMRKADQGLANNKGLAIGGLVTGIVGLLISLTVIGLYLTSVISSNNIYS
jgi:hypothetical protein